ncbi:helix-turn-helix transcriptional regulator [Orbus wheelerorum]|uniref:helix-turn-helix transcriptional regulator n=1 Tax=Orbus wheelerorum TaxID=3074111 RepID=UPI00370DDD00
MINYFIHRTKQALLNSKSLPFYLYSASSEQNLQNIAFTKPILIFIVNGTKEICSTETILCRSSEFIFLSDHKLLTVRNIPQQNEYMAFILEFECEDFIGIPAAQQSDITYIQGKVGIELQEELDQFVTISAWASKSILAHRRHEILRLLYELGYKNIARLGTQSFLGNKIHDFFIQSQFQNITSKKICDLLFMSESTLRRKLRQEKQSIKEIKANAQLGHGLHLLQTTEFSIQNIAEQCGYQTHSRFTENFKNRFGLTPKKLRKTKNIV